MRKAVYLALACVALGTGAIVLAHGGHCGDQVKIEVEITAINPPAMQITVDETTVQVTADTVIRRNCQNITFEDLEVGLNAMVMGTYDNNGVLVATRIMVSAGAPMPPRPAGD